VRYVARFSSRVVPVGEGPRRSRGPLRQCKDANRVWRGRTTVIVVVACLGSLLAASTASAVPAKPPTTESFYVGTTSTLSAEEAGCTQGVLAATDHVNTAVILDFGGQLSSRKGTESTNRKIDFTNAQIESIAEAFGEGFLVCTGLDLSNYVGIIIGTNNDKSAVSKAGGEAWAELVKRVANRVLSNEGEAKQVAIWGGDDMEVDYSTGSKTLAWAKAFVATTESPYIDYGDAAGCPETSHENGSCTGGKSGWNQKVEWELSWKLLGANPVPEIYYNPAPGAPANAEQWAQIDLYGKAHAAEMSFLGVLDQKGAESSDTNEEAWDQLEGQLETHSLYERIFFSLAI
jgi:hypothetical protein